MAIRFRCAYCGQLMGIGRRKSGSVVRCPKCSGQVVVPAASEPGTSVTPPPPSSPRLTAQAQPAPGSVFEFGDDDGASTEPADEPLTVVALSGPGPISGYFVATKHLLLAGILSVVLLAAAFFLGWMLRGR